MRVCSKCGIEKLEEEFNFRHKDLGIRHERCKSCTRKYGSDFYVGHRKERIALSAKRNRPARMQNIEKRIEYLLEHPCVDCGEADPLVLDFDHVRGIKDRPITRLLNSHCWASILKEIAKCVVRCSNCHRRKTARERNWKQIEVIERLRRKTIG